MSSNVSSSSSDDEKPDLITAGQRIKFKPLQEDISVSSEVSSSSDQSSQVKDVFPSGDGEDSKSKSSGSKVSGDSVFDEEISSLDEPDNEIESDSDKSKTSEEVVHIPLDSSAPLEETGSDQNIKHENLDDKTIAAYKKSADDLRKSSSPSEEKKTMSVKWKTNESSVNVKFLKKRVDSLFDDTPVEISSAVRKSDRKKLSLSKFKLPDLTKVFSSKHGETSPDESVPILYSPSSSTGARPKITYSTKTSPKIVSPSAGSKSKSPKSSKSSPVGADAALVFPGSSSFEERSEGLSSSDSKSPKKSPVSSPVKDDATLSSPGTSLYGARPKSLPLSTDSKSKSPKSGKSSPVRADATLGFPGTSFFRARPDVSPSSTGTKSKSPKKSPVSSPAKDNVTLSFPGISCFGARPKSLPLSTDSKSKSPKKSKSSPVRADATLGFPGTSFFRTRPDVPQSSAGSKSKSPKSSPSLSPNKDVTSFSSGGVSTDAISNIQISSPGSLRRSPRSSPVLPIITEEESSSDLDSSETEGEIRDANNKGGFYVNDGWMKPRRPFKHHKMIDARTSAINDRAANFDEINITPDEHTERLIDELRDILKDLKRLNRVLGYEALEDRFRVPHEYVSFEISIPVSGENQRVEIFADMINFYNLLHHMLTKFIKWVRDLKRWCNTGDFNLNLINETLSQVAEAHRQYDNSRVIQTYFAKVNVPLNMRYIGDTYRFVFIEVHSRALQLLLFAVCNSILRRFAPPTPELPPDDLNPEPEESEKIN